jgi:geranylgeranyl diphosphate synthase type II
MQTHKELLEKFNSDLNKLNFGTEPSRLYEPIYYTLQMGGKRIRPILCLMASDLYDGNYNDVINAAFGIEIFHNFTLLHDDMMDNSSTRRGNPVVHVKWNENIALLSGDAMSVMAYKYISKAKNNLQQILEIFSETALQICEGQQYDMDFELELNVSVDDYIKMTTLKTAVLLAGSLKIGAISANADIEDCNNLYEFGKNIGLAFQLQDDLLDVFGNNEKFKKNLGGDIVSNKKTYLLIKALELADIKTKEKLNYWLSAKEFNPAEKINAVKSIYKSLTVKEYTIELINKYFSKAEHYINLIKVTDEKKKYLLDFTKSLKFRDY